MTTCIGGVVTVVKTYKYCSSKRPVGWVPKIIAYMKVKKSVHGLAPDQTVLLDRCLDHLVETPHHDNA